MLFVFGYKPSLGLNKVTSQPPLQIIHTKIQGSTPPSVFEAKEAWLDTTIQRNYTAMHVSVCNNKLRRIHVLLSVCFGYVLHHLESVYFVFITFAFSHFLLNYQVSHYRLAITVKYRHCNLTIYIR